MNIIGAGLAGSEAALQLAQRGVHVRLFEMRPETETDVHRGGDCAELVCSNSLKSTKPESAAGMHAEIRHFASDGNTRRKWGCLLLERAEARH